MLDWHEAEEHLKTSEQVYTVFDSAGYLVLTYDIFPLRDRLSKGERTEELWHDIMEIAI